MVEIKVEETEDGFLRVIKRQPLPPELRGGGRGGGAEQQSSTPLRTDVSDMPTSQQTYSTTNQASSSRARGYIMKPIVALKEWISTRYAHDIVEQEYLETERLAEKLKTKAIKMMSLGWGGGLAASLAGYFIPSTIKIVYDTIEGVPPLEASADISFLKTGLYLVGSALFGYGLGGLTYFAKAKEKRAEANLRRRRAKTFAELVVKEEKNLSKSLEEAQAAFDQTIDNLYSKIEVEIEQKLGNTKEDLEEKINVVKNYFEEKFRDMEEISKISVMNEEELKEYITGLVGEDYAKEEVLTKKTAMDLYSMLKKGEDSETLKEYVRTKVMERRHAKLQELIAKDEEIPENSKNLLSLLMGSEELKESLWESTPEEVYKELKKKYQSFVSIPKEEPEEPEVEKISGITLAYLVDAFGRKDALEIAKELDPEKKKILYMAIEKIDRLEAEGKYPENLIKATKKALETIIKEGKLKEFSNPKELWDNVQIKAAIYLMSEELSTEEPATEQVEDKPQETDLDLNIEEEEIGTNISDEEADELFNILNEELAEPDVPSNIEKELEEIEKIANGYEPRERANRGINDEYYIKNILLDESGNPRIVTDEETYSKYGEERENELLKLAPPGHVAIVKDGKVVQVMDLETYRRLEDEGKIDEIFLGKQADQTSNEGA